MNNNRPGAWCVVHVPGMAPEIGANGGIMPRGAFGTTVISPDKATYDMIQNRRALRPCHSRRSKLGLSAHAANQIASADRSNSGQCVESGGTRISIQIGGTFRRTAVVQAISSGIEQEPGSGQSRLKFLPSGRLRNKSRCRFFQRRTIRPSVRSRTQI